MSVRKGDRSESKLQVLNRAMELKKYSLDKIKGFPKSTRWIYAAPIAEEVRAARAAIRHANSVYFTAEYTEDYKYRHGEQVKAHAHLDELIGLVEDAYLAGYISGDQLEFWSNMIIDTDNMLKAWIKADKEKLKQ